MKASEKNPQTRARLLGMAVALMVLLAGGTGASEIRITGPGTPVQPAYFGMHIHRADTTTAWPIARFATWRLWDTGVSWERLEPAQDAWDFRRLDALVNLAQQHGVEPMLTLGITPRWAASRPDEKFVYGNGGNSPPRDMHDWEDYVRTVAMRYKGRIRYFELWNEPTFDEIDKGKGFYAGSARTMVELGRIAHRVIKSVDPDNKLISPGFTDEGQRLDLYLRLGGKEITDVVAHHFYPEKPELISDYVGHVRRVMARHGLSNTPLWNTETGYWLEAPGEKNSPNWPHTQSDLAGNLARILVLTAATGVDRLYWYSWEKTMFNGMAKDIQSNSIILAYMQTMRWLRGVKVKSCATQDRRIWICDLESGSRQARMVWSTKGTISWMPPTPWQVRQIETLDARVIPYESGQSLQLGPVPQLIKSDLRLWGAQAGGN
jgi:hypothetical protein